MSLLLAAVVTIQTGIAAAPIGVAASSPNAPICVAMSGPVLSNGSVVTLIQPERPQSLLIATISRAVKSSEGLARADVAGPYYVAEPASAMLPETVTVWIVFRGRVATRRIASGAIAVQLEKSQRSAQARWCTSHEGLHLTVWAGEPPKSQRLWHEYFYLGYDVEPTCDALDGQ